jgi:uracil-DNA glycosylase family 4
MTIIDDYKTYRSYVEDCRDNPLHGEEFQCIKTGLTGPGIPAFCHPERCQLLFVGDFPSKDEIAQTSKFRSPFIDRRGKLLTEALREAGLYGDDRMGFTNLVKCMMPTRRSFKKCCETCHWSMQMELDIIRPLVVVLLGESVAKFAYPEIVEQMGGWHTIIGEEFDYFDTHLLFLPDPIDFKTGSGQDKDTVTYRFHLVVPLIKIKQRLMSHDDYFMLAYQKEA